MFGLHNDFKYFILESALKMQLNNLSVQTSRWQETLPKLGGILIGFAFAIKYFKNLEMHFGKK